MENASKALLIAGAILLCILIIAIGMFIYNSAQETIVSSLNSLSTQEIEAFNNQFVTYQGVQKGTNVKALMGRLIANAHTYADEPSKIPAIYIDHTRSNSNNNLVEIVNNAGVTSNYIDVCGKIRKEVEIKHEYYVYLTYQPNGLIDFIEIRYKIPKDPNKYLPIHRD